jgi:MFS family permease
VSNDRLLTRDFLLVSAITFITFFAGFQLFPTAPLQLRQLGASLAESGRFLTVFTAGSSLGALVTGSLGDRVGQRRMVVACAAGFGLLVGAYGLLRVRWAIYLLAFPHGVVWSGLLTATMATLGHVLPPRRRADGLSLYGLASPAGVVFGPTAGLAVYQRWGFPAMAWGLCLAFLVLALLALSLPRDARAREPHAGFQLPGRSMLAPALVLLATALGYGALSSYTAQEALVRGFRPVLGVPTVSAFFSCMALGMVAMRLFMARAGFGRHPTRLLPGMLWVTAAGLGLLTFLPWGAPRHALAALLYGAGYSMVHTLVNTQVLESTPPSRRGAAFGANLFAFDAGIGLGSLAIGGLIGWGCGRFGPDGFRLGWAAAAALALVAVPLAHRLVRSGTPAGSSTQVQTNP